MTYRTDLGKPWVMARRSKVCCWQYGIGIANKDLISRQKFRLMKSRYKVFRKTSFTIASNSSTHDLVVDPSYFG